MKKKRVLRCSSRGSLLKFVFRLYFLSIFLVPPLMSAAADGGDVQQRKTVAGIVTDQTGQPFPGVTVLEKGTTNGTVTTPDGEYSLNLTGKSDTLQFSFIGMKTQLVPVNDRTVINIVLEEET